jgi:hypothetical protein
MKYQKKIVFLMLFSSFLIILAFIFDTPFDYRLCPSSPRSMNCEITYKSLAIPALSIGVVIFLNSILLLFQDESVFKRWMRFTIYSLPVFALLLFFAASGGGGSRGTMSMSSSSVPSEFMIGFISLLYLVISLIVIFRKKK